MVKIISDSTCDLSKELFVQYDVEVLPLHIVLGENEYEDDPIFSNSKIVLSLYNDTPAENFAADFKDKIALGNITAEDVDILSEPSGINLAKLAASYSDGIILGADEVPAEIVDFCKEAGLPVLPYNAESLKDGSYIDDYNSFYDSI